MLEIGQKFNNLTINSEQFRKDNGRYYVNVLCEYGTEHEIRTDYLLKSSSCSKCKPIDSVIGQKHNRLTAISDIKTKKGERKSVDCLCDCGKTLTVDYYNWIGNVSKSCGCLKSECASAHAKQLNKNRIKDYTSHPLYFRYRSIVNSNDVCDSWANPNEFYKWAESKCIDENMLIRSIDKNKPIGPDNVEIFNTILKTSDCEDKSLVGNIYGYLEVIGPIIGVKKYGRQIKYVECKCLFNNCGNTKVYNLGSIKQGQIKSCGCYSTYIKKSREPKNKIDGRSSENEYQIWCRIKSDSVGWTYESFKEFYLKNNPNKLFLFKNDKTLPFSESNVIFIPKSEMFKRCGTNREKAMATNMKRYGVPNPCQNKDIQNKAAKTKSERYNDPHFNKSSGAEQKTFGAFISTIGKFHKDRTILNGKEIDYFSDELRLGFEYNGIFYHTEDKGRTKFYHYDKYSVAASQGVTLIQIWSDKWILEKDLVKNQIMWFLNLQEDETEKSIIENNTIRVGKTTATIENGEVRIDFDYSKNCPKNLFSLIKVLGTSIGYETLIFVSDNDFPIHRKFTNLIPVVDEYPSPFFVQKSNSRNRVEEGENTSRVWNSGKTICLVK